MRAQCAVVPFAVVSLLTGFAFCCAAELTVHHDEAGAWVDVFEDGVPVLRYNHGSVERPKGIGVSESEHGNYISRLYGPGGALITEDYPKDHPHHRAVNWSWATIQWKGKTRDMFWGKGAWARPVRMARAESGPGGAVIEAESVWKWDDEIPIVNERVLICVHPSKGAGTVIDFELHFTPVVEGLAFCGRLDEGYSGFNLRMAPGRGQATRRAWADYSAIFPRGVGRAGVAVVQHADNPGYPHEWRKYDALNFFQPVFPGGKPVPLPQDETVDLKYRLWVHFAGPSHEQMNALWDDYNRPAQASGRE